MTKVYSHIESTSHFDTIWNEQVDRYSKYFSYTKNLAFAYQFKYTAYIYKLYQACVSDTVSNMSQIDLNMFLNQDTNYLQLMSMFNLYEPRKKKVKEEKYQVFSQTYDTLSNSDKSVVYVPVNLDFYTQDNLSALYPSVRASMVDFLVSKDLVTYDAKTSSLALRKYKCNIQDVATINSKASHSQVYDYQQTVNLKEVLNKIDSTFNSLQQDKQYLEDHIKILSRSIDTLNAKLQSQEQEGINGYLLTWH